MNKLREFEVGLEFIAALESSRKKAGRPGERGSGIARVKEEEHSLLGKL